MNTKIKLRIQKKGNRWFMLLFQVIHDITYVRLQRPHVCIEHCLTILNFKEKNPYEEFK